MTVLKFPSGPRSHGFSPGLVYRIAKVRDTEEGMLLSLPLAVKGCVIVRNGGAMLGFGGLGMYTARV